MTHALAEKLREENAALIAAIRDIHWMARRYADGRRSYAVGMFNDATRKLLAIGALKSESNDADGTVWARDGDNNRGMDGLTHVQATMGYDCNNKIAQRVYEHAVERESKIDRLSSDNAALAERVRALEGESMTLADALRDECAVIAEALTKAQWIEIGGEKHMLGSMMRKAHDAQEATARAIAAAIRSRMSTRPAPGAKEG